MAREDTFYSSSTPQIAPYGNNSNTEADMRLELIRTLEGGFPEISKGHWALLRKMRRDASGRLIECPCVDPLTHEPDKDQFCPISMNERYLFDESYIKLYSVIAGTETSPVHKEKITSPGLINTELVVFYTRYDSNITEDDKIVEIELELDGSKIEPVVRRQVYKIIKLWAYRADNGKLEYYKLYTSKENVKHLNPPSYG